MGIWLSEPMWSMVARSARQSVGPLLPSGVGRAHYAGSQQLAHERTSEGDRHTGCARRACCTGVRRCRLASERWNVWNYLRGNKLSHRVWDSYDAIVRACAEAWRFLIGDPDRIRSIATRAWASVNV
jgi:hypothetical protein